jgi:hypothetical protein
VLVAAIVASCGGSQAPAQSCPDPTPGGDPKAQPEGIALQDFGTMTETAHRGDFVSAAVISERSVDQLYDPLRDHVKDGGYSILNTENEHFEAEIFFADERGKVALLQLREGPCLGQVTIRLTYG